MSSSLRCTVAVICLMLVGPFSPARAATSQRVYLLGATEGHRYWSNDPTDPEARALSASCGFLMSRACLRGVSTSGATMYFDQAAVVDAPIPISASTPIRFHLEMKVSALPGYTVQLVMQRGGKLSLSETALEVQPGIFEGALKTGVQLDATAFTYFGVRINTSDTQMQLTVKTQGASWLEFAAPAQIRSVPELIRNDTYAPDPVTVRTAERSFGLNDRDYELSTFTARLGGQATSVDVQTDRAVSTLFAWVEGITPTVFGVSRGDTAPDSPNDLVSTKLSWNGTVIGTGGGNIAAGSIPAGRLTLTITSSTSANDVPVTGYILRVYGERSLSWMRWRFSLPGLGAAHRTPETAQCPSPSQQIPSSPALRSFAVDLSWESPSPLPQRWTWSYDIFGVGSFPCAESGNDTHLRFTFPGERVWRLGPTPATTDTFVSVADVVFEGDAHFTYQS